MSRDVTAAAVSYCEWDLCNVCMDQKPSLFSVANRKGLRHGICRLGSWDPQMAFLHLSHLY